MMQDLKNYQKKPRKKFTKGKIKFFTNDNLKDPRIQLSYSIHFLYEPIKFYGMGSRKN